MTNPTSTVSPSRGPLATLRLIVVALALTVPLATATAAEAGAPTWKVGSEASPTDLPPGGTGRILIQVANIGSANTDGSSVTVTDQLPAGVEALEAGELKNNEGEVGSNDWVCEGAHLVTCTNNAVNLPVIGPGVGRNSLVNIDNPSGGGAYSKLEAPEIAIAVRIAPGADTHAQNIVHVSGGGANGASDEQSITLSPTPAGFGISRFRSYLTNQDGSFATQAGGHPSNLTVDLSLNIDEVEANGLPNTIPAGDAKNITVEAPAGIVGDPQSAERCTREEFDGPNDSGAGPECPTGSEIGEAIIVLGDSDRGTLPLTLPVFNLVPPPGVPAEFGFEELGIYGTLDASVRTGGDYGITEHIDNTAQRSFFASSITLWGVPADSSHDLERHCLVNGIGHFGCSSTSARRPFLSSPTSCGAIPPWHVEATSWQDFPPANATSETYSNQGLVQPLSGCERLAFEPAMSVQGTTTSADSPSGLAVDVHVPQTYENPEALATPTVKDVSVALPAGMAISPSAANGLTACTPAEIGISNGQPVACPNESKVGSVEVNTPLLPNPLHGSVYVAQQNENPFGSLLAIYITAEGEGALIKLAGHVEADPLTGQLTTVVDNAPQLPFEDFKLDLFGGERAALVSPSECGTGQAVSTVTGYSSEMPVTLSSPMTISSGCGGGFAPNVAAGSTSTGAAQFTSFTTTLSRADGEQRFERLRLTLPPGLLGEVKNVPRCPEAQANAGTCGAESLIGHTEVAAGPGADPFWIEGKVYLTGPYGGAPFGLSIVTQAIAGPYNLGTVVVRAKIDINPATAQITASSDPFPTILQGIPLDLRSVNVTIDRPNFIFDPTNCNPLTVTGVVTSTQNAVASIAEPFQASDCATLAFKPVLSASTAGTASKANGASLDVKVSYPNGPIGSYANIKSVKVDLPKQLPSRLTTLQKACLAATFEANPANCPSASDVGTATASTPVLSAPLIGPAYLVSHGGEAFPDLEIVLQGENITLILDGNTQIKKGITSSTFKAIPDAPVSGFELKLPTGKFSILGANVPQSAKYSLCGQTLSMPTVITAQNGAVIKQATQIAVTGCAKKKALTRSQKLAVALKACRKKAKGKRAGCEKAARKRYPRAKSKKVK